MSQRFLSAAREYFRDCVHAILCRPSDMVTLVLEFSLHPSVLSKRDHHRDRASVASKVMFKRCKMVDKAAIQIDGCIKKHHYRITQNVKMSHALINVVWELDGFIKTIGKTLQMFKNPFSRFTIIFSLRQQVDVRRTNDRNRNGYQRPCKAEPVSHVGLVDAPSEDDAHEDTGSAKDQCARQRDSVRNHAVRDQFCINFHHDIICMGVRQ